MPGPTSARGPNPDSFRIQTNLKASGQKVHGACGGSHQPIRIFEFKPEQHITKYLQITVACNR
jgi:hypothetical protein